MKLTTFILLAAFLHVSAATFAQRVTINQTHTTLKEFFNQVHEQTGYTVLWSAGDVNSNQQIEVSLKGTPLPEALDQALEHTNLEYTIENKTVVIRKKEPGLIDRIKTALGTPVTVTAKVYDELGQPMPGVNIRQKATQNGTTTDSKGNFSISVPDNNTVLVFSFVGYETQELAAKDIPNASVITLKASSTNLKEVVINKGYYHTTQELNTGNVTKISGETINEQPVTDPLMALEGRVAGLYISQASGIPGAYGTVRLRGQNSIANGNNPLYVVDGVPFNSTSLTQVGGALGIPSQGAGFGASPFNFLDPSDIESIDVLKDADATAIYGSRGANGVILITTKKGKAGHTTVDINLSQGAGQVTRMLDLLNTQQYLQMRHEAFSNGGTNPGPGDYDINGVWDTTRYTNWEKVFIGGTAQYTNVQGNVSGGNTNTQFIISGGYSDQTTVYPGDYSDQKGSLHFNLTNSSEDQKFHMNFSASYVSDNSDLPGQDFTQSFITLAPDAPPGYNADGSLNWANSTWGDPYAQLIIHRTAGTKNLISNLNLSYEILKGLFIKANFGYNNISTKESEFAPITAYNPVYATADSRYFDVAQENVQTWIIEPGINYTRAIGKGKLDVLIGSTFQENDQDQTNIDAYGFSSDALIQNLGAASNSVLSNSLIQYHYNAIFGRINYNWEDKYLLNLTARRDGSSRFGPGNQFGNFAAVGAGWIFSKEKFIENNFSFLSFGKLRGSYGTSGNDQITDYQYLATYSVNPIQYQGLTGLYPTQIPNPNYGWESVKKLEGGLELGFLKDRIQINTSYYIDRTGNQLVSYPLPSIAGFGSIEANLPAVVQNTGFELELNTLNVKSKDFSWNTSANFTLPTNKLLSYPNLGSSPYANTYVIGQSLYIQKLYHFTGINPQTGLYTFETNNANGVPSFGTDRTAIKQIGQKFFGGFGNGFSYKGLKLDCFLQFVDQTAFSYVNKFPAPGRSNLTNQPVYVLNAWQQPGDITNIQKFSTSSIANSLYRAYGESDAAVTNASFMRLKNVSLSYTLPANWQKNVRMKNAQIFLQAQNLITITKYQGLDPETQGLSLPPLRMITIGTHISF